MAEVRAQPRARPTTSALIWKKDVRSGLTTGLEHYHFVHQALPELTSRPSTRRPPGSARPCAWPLLISSMTGGTETAPPSIAPWCRGGRSGIAMGLGSAAAPPLRTLPCDDFPGARRGARHPAVRQPGRGPVQLWLRSRPVPPSGGHDPRGCADPHLSALQEASSPKAIRISPACWPRSRPSAARCRAGDR